MTKFTCDLCHGLLYQLVYAARGSFTNTYLITDRSYGQHLPIVRCTTCQLVQAYPQITARQTISRYQSFVDPEYDRESANRSRNCLRILAKLGQPGRLLDVGCATGLMLEQASRLGWQAEGVEPSKWAAQVGQSKGLKIHQGTLDLAKLRSASFDAITCIDVIEHVSSPRTLVGQMVKLLKPHGVLCIVTPDSGSLLAKTMGEHWWHIRPDHFYYFSPATLTTVCQQAGLQKQSIGTYAWTFSLGYWLSRAGLSMPQASLAITIDFHDSLLGCFVNERGNINPA